MGKVAPVVVHRRSFASALVLGFFGTLCVLIICGASVAIYGMKMVNDKLDELIAISPEALTAVTSWQEAMPPAVTDALQDRRMPQYRNQVEIHTELVRDWRTERQIPVVEVTNNGDQVISLMSLRLLIQDEDLVPIEELTIYAATPLAMDSQWRGPLLPGSKRRFKAGHIRCDVLDDLVISSEICELRVWDPNSDSGLITPRPEATVALHDDTEPETTTITSSWGSLADDTTEVLESDTTAVEQPDDPVDESTPEEEVVESAKDDASR
jgi:hypothetical protein